MVLLWFLFAILKLHSPAVANALKNTKEKQQDSSKQHSYFLGSWECMSLSLKPSVSVYKGGMEESQNDWNA